MWIRGTYRTEHAIIMDVKGEGGKYLDARNIRNSADENPEDDTMGRWEDCLIGLMEELSIMW